MQTQVFCRKHVRSAKATRRGVIAVLAAFLMVAMLALMAFAIDIGMLGNSRTDLQRSADAAALAAAAELTANPGNEIPTALSFAKQNLVTNTRLTDANIQVEIGTWNRATRTFSAGSEPADAVRVLTTMNDQPLFFAKALGSQTYNMQASAVATFQPRDIMLVLDYSGSMLDENKIGNLKAAVDMFCTLVNSTSQGKDRVGFVRYSTTASLQKQLTFNLVEVSHLARQGNASGFTNIGDAMHLATQELELNARPRAKKLIVLLTDGLANRPLNVNPVQHVINEAHAAAARNYPIASISFGSDADQTLMSQVASISKGVHFHVAGSVAQQENQLKAVFRKVAVNRNLQLVD
jgi:Ca-activated chloride channel homolog